MSKKIAVYAGSFDPVTRGHEWVIRGAADIFDEVVVVVAENASKRTMFSSDERVTMIQESIADVPHVTVVIVSNRFVVQWAYEQGARWMIRGMRNTIDFEYEAQVLDINRRMCADVSTVYFPASPHGVAVSSSTVKGLVGIQGWQDQVDAYVSPHVKRALFKKQVERELRERFAALWKRLDASSIADDVFSYIFSQYCEPHRKYHTWQHLYEALNHFDRVSDLCEHPDQTELALWVHDLFYTIGASDNETQSAEEAYRLCVDAGQNHAEASFVRSVVDALAHKREPQNIDEQCAVDCDLAILGQNEVRYCEYMAHIREEYASVPEKLFCTKRAEILRGFLNRLLIYHTKVMRELFEENARANLGNEIALLEERARVL